MTDVLAPEAAAPAEVASTRRTGDRLLVALFVVTTFLGAALLFLVQPMVAKMLLPRLGGTPDVWNTAMVFFQAMLLAGYAFAHASTALLGMRRQPIVQLVVLLVPLALLPVAIPTGWEPPTGVAPALWTLLALAVAVGAPFFVLSTSSPTLQRWFSVTDHPAAGDPYFLYAAGNVGSLLALVGYPLVLEPRFSLEDQSRLWSLGYVLFVLACTACVVALRRRRAIEPDPAGHPSVTTGIDAGTAEVGLDDEPVSWARRGRWVLLALVPSALMLAVTRHISTDIASVPLLWVLPLGLYLISFIAAFGRDPSRVVSVSSRLVRLLIIPVALAFVARFSFVWLVLVPHLVLFFLIALLAHGRLALDRPAPRRLTEFYLWISVGGVLGGIACALLAPVLFDSVIEYPLILAVALALRTPTPDEARHQARQAWVTAAFVLAVTALVAAAVVVQEGSGDTVMGPSLVLLGIAAGLVYVAARTAPLFALGLGLILAATTLLMPLPVLHAERTFFGVHRVLRDPDGRHLLANGTTTHGMQDPGRPDEPLSYYHREGPIGNVFANLGEQGPPRDVAVIGLGSGALAAYGRAGDDFTFYEIDQSVIDIASDPEYFTYLSETPAAVHMVVGDGRLRLGAADETYDVVVLDAFSSDAVPVHLLTVQAVQQYLDHLGPDGVIAFHVSNRYFDLSPVLNRVARELGLSGVIRSDDPAPADLATGHFASEWVVLSRSDEALEPLLATEDWSTLDVVGDAPLWTDSFSDLLGSFRWSAIG